MGRNMNGKTKQDMSHEEKAFLCRLLAMNTLFEAARAGEAGRSLVPATQANAEILQRMLVESEQT